MNFNKLKKYFLSNDQAKYIQERAHFKFSNAQLESFKKDPRVLDFKMNGDNIASRLFTDGHEIDTKNL